LRLPSDEAYAEAFLEVFTEAVRCRLRGAGPVGSMLSGGIDSGSVVAVARELLAAAGQGPLPTFSAVGPDPEACVETRTIHVALTIEGLEPHLIRHDQLDELLPELETLTWELDEPFDNHMTLLRAVYLAAHRQGIKALLDGVAGDTVLSPGSHLARLLRSGHWRTAYREAMGQNRFYNGAHPAWHELYRSMRMAFVPNWLRRLRRRLHPLSKQQRVEDNLRTSLISPEFAQRVKLAERLQALDRYQVTGLLPSYGQERACAIDNPSLVVGRERYDRTAAAIAMEPRDPLLDRRVVDICLALPGEHKLSGGWPKVILRKAMAGRLPDAARWRRGKEHLGWSFTSALMSRMPDRMRVDIEANWDIILPYINANSVRQACRTYLEDGDLTQAEQVYTAAHLAIWLRRHAARPKAAGSTQSQAYTNFRQ
jgi:asparagine synthase (glutamine-hydrolysing)